MVRQLPTIIEVDISDVSEDDVPQLISGKSTGKDVTYCSPLVELELSEPESELDPFHSDPIEIDTRALEYDSISFELTPQAHSTKTRKKRHASLIDKAFKAQQNQAQDLPTTREPVYIRFGDLAADWSLYTSRFATRSLNAPLLRMDSVDVHEAIDVQEASVGMKTKRNRKKSLIDKAASQQRREELKMQQAKAMNY